jgi:regulation of enolase protein 1 (concanavalin A-like superfamily)
VTGAGADIWNTSDQFQFVYQPVQGDTQIVARVANVQATDPWSKAGVMIRQSLTAGSAHAAVVGTAASGWNFLWRSAADTISFSTHGPSGAAPGWLKLARVGNVFTSYLSSDGVSWTQLDTEPITMSGTVYIGLAVTSHNPSTRATDSFTNVAVTAPSGNQAPNVSITSPASGATFTASANITINATATDSDGTVAQVDFYHGSTLIGSDTASPYSVTWSSAPAGSYQLTAVAKDNTGATTTSAAVNVTVNAAGNQAPTVSITSPTSGASYTAPANMTINATASDADGTIAGVDFYQGSTLISTDTTSPYSATWNTVGAGTYSLTAVARDNAGASRTSSAVSVTVSGSLSGLPSPWVNTDVGSPSLAGSTTSPSSGSFSVTGAGTDIWGTADQFQFAYQPVQGDTQIVARVANVQATDPWSKGGIMIRQSLTAGSQHAAVVGTAANGWNFLWRSTSGGTSFSTHGPSGAAPGWVKLTRVGNTISAYLSSDGATWTALDNEPITMSGTVYVGLVVTSHSPGARATDSFTNVAVTAVSGTNQPPTVSITSPASGATFTAPASITINASASDSDGTVSSVDFYQGSTLIATDTTNPYSASWTNVGAGTYSLTAVARDNAGATKTSTAVSVTVNGTSQPTTLIFTASVDHATAVMSYVVAIYRSTDDPATASPVATRDIGKPMPASNGDITVDITSLVDPLPSGSYKVVVRAVGTGGTTPSVPSPNFTK